jgi:type 2 lantibiotic biosynthesis protein LanM
MSGELIQISQFKDDKLSSHNFNADYFITITNQDIIKIVEKVSTLTDRLTNKFISNQKQTEDKLIDSRLDKWCQVSAKGDRSKFVKYLAWNDLEIERVRDVLGSVKLADESNLPSWVETLQAGMQKAALSVLQTNNQQRRYLEVENPLPFENLLIPFIDLAAEKLIDRADAHYHLLSEEAHSNLEHSLLLQLIGLCASVLELEFSIYRSLHHSPLTLAIAQAQGNTSNKQYQEFVHKLLKDGLRSFFLEYSVLAKLISTAIDFWVDNTAEFLSRLSQDWNQIQATFGDDKELGRVVSIETSLSDPHNGGKSVIILQFADERKLVYKPKNLGLEKAYYDFLKWINEQKASLPLKLVKVIDCSTYGWMEFVEAFPCEDEEAIKRYYQRSGMLLCLVYILRGTDCHYENLIASGEQPVLIDLETLLHHRTWVSQDNAEADEIAREKLQDSVSGTAFLPGWQLIPYEKTSQIDLSGLGGSGEQEFSYPVLKWQHINTDSMTLVQEEIKLQSKQNQPFKKGINQSLNNYSEELIDGFRQMYQLFGERKEELLAPNSPLTIFAKQKVRLVLRNTSVYASILQKSLNHKYLRDGVERSIQLDILARAFLASEEKHPFWGILAPEKQALEQLDIPYFTADSNSTEIAIDTQQKIEQFLNAPSYNDVLDRIKQLDDGDLGQQISIIRGSLYSCFTKEQLNLMPPKVSTSDSAVTSFDRTELIQYAIAIAEKIKQQAIYGQDGSVTWLGMEYLALAEKFQLQPLGYSLYNGRCGIAIFLSAIAKVTPQKEFRNLALAAIQPLRNIIQNFETNRLQKITEQIGIGGAKGVASIVYSFVRIADFLNETELMKEAEQLTTWILPDRVIGKPMHDLLNGTAGTILSLLSLYGATKQSETLKIAITWGKYLLNTLKQKNNKSDRLSTDFSFESFEITYALLRLYKASEDSLFLSAAQNMIFESQSSLFTEKNHHNFESINFNSWCNGLSGISLALLGCWKILSCQKMKNKLDNNLQIISQAKLQRLDNLSCGNFSQIEILLLASQQLFAPELSKIALEKTTEVLHQAKHRGYFQLLPNLTPEIYNPGFCQGTAGIGYELLRSADPDAIPSTLSFS